MMKKNRDLMFVSASVFLIMAITTSFNQVEGHAIRPAKASRIPAVTDDRKDKCPTTSPLIPSAEISKLKSEVLQWKSLAEMTSSLVSQLDNDMLFINLALRENGITIPAASSNRRVTYSDDQKTKKKTCCPSYKVARPLKAGVDMDGVMHDVVRRNNSLIQDINMVLCYTHVLNAPCRYLNDSVKASSKCVQQYSYTFALVKDAEGFEKDAKITVGGKPINYTYIRYPSGCSCEVEINY